MKPDEAVILVVDDDPASLDVAVRMLEREGYRTQRATSGPACLDIVQSEKIDLVLLDVMMPGMDGLQVCTALRALEVGKRLPIILLTARTDMETRVGGIHHGISEFLTKPINRHELGARVAAQLHILDLTRQLEALERRLDTKRPSSPRPATPR